MKDLRQSPSWAAYLKKTGWEVEKVGEVFCYIRKFPMIGSFVKIQRPEKIESRKINQLAQRHQAFQLAVEPRNQAGAKTLKAAGFVLSQSPYLPTKTLQLSLSQSKEGLRQGLKGDARYALRKTKGLKVRKTENQEVFRSAWKRAVGWKRYVPPTLHLEVLQKTFGQNCLFLQSKLNEEIVAGAIFLLEDKTAYYWQAFSNQQGRKAQAQYRLVWEGILWANKKKAQIFDFEGIYDQRFPRKSWLGFTHFKKSFGGSEVFYPGCFVKAYKPLGKLILVGT